MKQIRTRTATFATLTLLAAFASAQQQVQVTVNGAPVKFDAAQPEMSNGRVLVPFRGVFEQMGATVDWDPSTQSVTAIMGDRHVVLQIGSYDASVNGHVVSMDVTPAIIQDSTMVPLRFLSQSLGGHVDWQPQNDLVAITTPPPQGAPQRIVQAPPSPPPPPARVVVPPPTIIIERPRVAPPLPPPPAPPFEISRDTVLPLILDQELNSEHSNAGDRVKATVRSAAGPYFELPEGTRLEGYVRAAHHAVGSHGGTLDVRFTHLVFPDGTRYEIHGIVTKLDDSHIVRTDAGRFIAKGDTADYVARNSATGPGAGLYLNSLNGKPVGGSTVGGTLGSVVSIFDHSMAHNVIVPAGTKLGLILDHGLKIDRHDLR